MTKTARNSKEFSVIEFFFWFSRHYQHHFKQAPVLGSGEVLWLPGNSVIPSKFPLLDRSVSSRYNLGVALYDCKLLSVFAKGLV